MNNWKFVEFLHEIEEAVLPTNETTKGDITIQQTPRNELRRKGLDALKQDLQVIYGDEFDIVETKEGIVIVAENQADDWTFSWELKSTIKALNFDPFLEAGNWDEDQAAKRAKKERIATERAAKEKALAEKRAKAMARMDK